MFTYIAIARNKIAILEEVSTIELKEIPDERNPSGRRHPLL
jgi:hypothetical protein